MPEEIKPQLAEKQNTSDGGRLNASEAMTPPRWSEKIKTHKLKILGGVFGGFIFAGAVFGAYKLGQRQVPTQPGPQPTPGGQKVFCKDPRPEVCTMECIVNPPYICGSDGKSYCSTCQACSNPSVEWYIIQDAPCKGE